MNKLLCFTAEWCAPCRGMKPTLEKLDQSRIVRCDIDENPNKCATYRVGTVPTFILVDEYGKELDRIIGSTTLSNLTELLG